MKRLWFRASHSRWLAVAIISTAALLTGCQQNVDLPGVNAFAQSVGASSGAFSSIAGDFYSSCIREYDWAWAQALSHRRTKSLDEFCSAQQKAAQQWQQANLVVIEYVQALGNTAGGSDTQTDFGIPDLVSSINGITGSGLSDTQIKAVSTSGTSIVTDIFNLRRRKEIARYAPQANQDLDALIATLEDIAKTNYSRQLDLEQDAVDRFYSAVVPTAGPTTTDVLPTVQGLQKRLALSDKRSTNSQQLRSVLFDRVLVDFDRTQILALKQNYVTDRQGISDKRKAISIYVSALESIRKTHSQLVAAIESNSPGDVGKIAQAYIDEYGPEIKALENAFIPRGKTK